MVRQTGKRKGRQRGQAISSPGGATGGNKRPPSLTCYPLRRADSFTCSEPRSLHRHRKELVSGSLRTDGRSSSQDTNLDFTGRFAFHTWTRTGQDPNCITR
jgi:hypothetical protein